MRLVKFDPNHLYEIEPQEKQLSLIGQRDVMLKYIDPLQSFTAMTDRPIGCGGVFEAYGALQAWAVVSNYVKRDMVAATRAVDWFLSNYIEPIYTVVDCDFEQGHRWAKLLKFEATGEIVHNENCEIYVRDPWGKQ